ncbi:hypothetical protein AWC38_SpisGene3557 [Stylophora pistillata]|uniref:Uncharacterized protein n=1 Tax=Stylophora pistillata TaxID=50429 RepID=A0A2B4SRA3_STYPI|nr:hypothetical protein AWC38_SpisGene3557 [Stylophora pistillata]
MAFDLGRRVNKWINKAFSSKAFADSKPSPIERSGYLSTVSARRTEIDALLSSEENVHLVKEKLPGFLAAVERTQQWTKGSEELLGLNSQVNPEDSASQIGSRATTKSPSKKSRRSCHSGSNRSGTSSLAFARAKEAKRIAKLEAEAAALEKRRLLEEQRLCLQQEQERLTLETELAKSKAKDRVLSSVMETAPRPFVPNPINLESKKGEGKVQAPIIGLETKPAGANGHLSVAVGCSTLNPEAAEWHQPSEGTNRNERADESEYSGASTSPSERAFQEMLGLHHRRNALQQQQNKIVEMLATQQKKSSLPQQRVPIFDGCPMEYGALVRAFENLIESRTSSGTERLYYLEQFTSGDVKELVRLWHHLPPEIGYQEARWLVEKKFGNDYRIVTAYETKALNRPEVRAEDSASLDSRRGFTAREGPTVTTLKRRVRLTKWISPSRRVLETIPEAERAKKVKSLDLSEDDLPVERALGVNWCVETDDYGFKVDTKLKPPTRRGILSIVGSVYDPLGLAAPFVLTATRLLQDLCRVKLDWDDPIPQQHKARWERWMADLPKLSQFSVHRCIKPAGFDYISSSQLQHFSDVSESGFGSVSYLRLVNGEGAVHCSFLCTNHVWRP